ncbi:hypothetical protein BC828DRAFT_387327 [Blastocladiella britannica]|nr:hypothetical protein BC828DRAFT_387327 [Blastocladiella britannica]
MSSALDPPAIGSPNIVIRDQAKPSDYIDRAFDGSPADWYRSLDRSATVYVGNLSFYTTEEQIHELFAKCGDIKRIIMGLDKVRLTPCGFCFVEYYSHADALDCLRYISNTKLDDRFIRVDLDPGFKDQRQFGRGQHGGQVRDQYRLDYDPGRGGWAPSPAQPEQRAERSYADQYAGENLPQQQQQQYYNRGGGGRNGGGGGYDKRRRSFDEGGDQYGSAKRGRRTHG